ncbi:MAG: bifunctional heptose 7-phosphate kinase/heptose 1-phosphate adenyltransferase [Candidatus Dadabacteria bacterium]
MKDLNVLFGRFQSIKVGIIGDLMLDTYLWGTVDRISPEAPVPIITLQKKEQRLGGAGNVALNIKSLGATAYMIGITGADEDNRILMDLFSLSGINTSYCLTSTERITTNKTRIIGRNQQMMRLDAEILSDLNKSDEQSLIDSFTKFIETERPDLVILEDYNKGVLTEKVISEVISICNKFQIVTAVDPKRKNFFAYRSVNIFKPNLKEVRDALNLLSTRSDLNSLKDIHQQLASLLDHHISLITLSEKGVFYHDDKHAELIPSHVRSIADVSGAGDTVIAVASLVYAATKNSQLMAEISNIAGGLVCEEVGTVAIDKEKLLKECLLILN